MTEEFKDKFTAARQAYSYLHGFQKTLGDTLSHLVKQLDNTNGLTFAKKSTTLHTDHISMRQNPNGHDRWTWDWFPTYEYSVFYEWHSRPGTQILEVSFTCDDRWDGKSDIAPTIAGAGEAQSTVDLFLWKHPESDFDWHTAWNNSDYPDEMSVWEHTESGMEVMHISVPISSLETHQSIEAFADKAREKFEG